MVKKVNRQREVWKKIEAGFSMKERFHDFILDKVYRATLRGKKKEVDILSCATKILFPKAANVLVADAMFKALWKLKKHREAIRVYCKIGRLFWHAGDVGRYLERKGRVKEAMIEYQYLVDEYFKIRKNFLPLPRGPVELFKLGKWYSRTNAVKAREYLELYLSAEVEWKNDPAFFLRHKNQARVILDRLNKLVKSKI